MHKTYRFTKVLTIIIIAVLICIYIGAFVINLELMKNIITLVSITAVIYLSFFYGKSVGIISGFIIVFFQLLITLDYSIFNTSISPLKIMVLFENINLSNTFHWLFVPIIGFITGKYSEIYATKLNFLESNVESLDNTISQLSTRLSGYDNKFKDLSTIKVYKRSWDNIINNNQNTEQIIGIMVSQISEKNSYANTDTDLLTSTCFSFLLSIKPEILAIMDLSGKINLYNETLMALYGYTYDDMITGKSILDFIIPADIKRASETIHNFLLNNQNVYTPYTIKTKDGRNLRKFLMTEITFTATGSPLSLIACASCISANSNQSALHGDNQNVFTINQLMQKSIWCISLDFKTTFINLKAAELLGYSVNYITGKKIDSFFSLDNLSLLKEFLSSCKDSENKSIDMEVLTMKKDRRIFKAYGYPSFDAKGCHLETTLFIEDITEQKLLEEALSHRIALEQMITNISTRFITIRAEELESEITRALKIFGDFEDAKMSYVEIYPSEKIKERKQYKVINGEDVASVSEEDLETVYIPIIIETEPAGFFRFYHNMYFNNWLEYDLELIKLLGEIIINALIRKNNELSIKLNENRLFTTLLSIGDAVIATDINGLVVMLNKKAEDLTGWANNESINKPLDLVFDITIENNNSNDNKEPEAEKKHLSETYESVILKSRNGTEIFVSVTRTNIEDNNSEVYGEVIVFRDITLKKLEDDEIRYISFHDRLTGLYNRAFFEEELVRLNTKRQYPITIIIGDCNGLKIANDVFGHLEGDKLLQKVAAILKQSTRKEDIVARWGGDEFAIILPKTDELTAASIRERILSLCIEAKNYPIQPSLALGSATKTEDTDDIIRILKLAEDRMYRHKLLEGKSARNAIITSIEKMIYEKSYETEEHAKRLIDVSLKVGNAIGLSDYELEELSLLSVLHDMGKIGIPDSILMKSEKLSESEWELMKKHSEKGYNIAKSTPELINIADSILHHHEHWDGTGYPAGLKGNDIPKLSRLLSIIDAYDVITHSRPYKDAQSNEEALNEIKRCGGTHFDPELSEIFVKVMSEQETKTANAV